MSSPINAIVVFPIIKIPKRRHTWVVCVPGAEDKYLVTHNKSSDYYVVADPERPETHAKFFVRLLLSADSDRDYSPGTMFYADIAKTRWEIHNDRISALAKAFELAAVNNCGIIDLTRKA